MFVDFVEVGTCDFDTLIENATDVTFGLSIEGIKSFLDKLPDKPNVKKINCIISDCEGDEYIYTVHPDLYTKFPEWVRGSNSIAKPHPIVVRWLTQNKLPLDVFVRYKVPKKTLYNVLQENNISSIDYLKVDTEGHDELILKKFISDINEHSNFKLFPRKIQFESNELHKDEDVKEMIGLLEQCNYKFISRGFDVVMEQMV